MPAPDFTRAGYGDLIRGLLDRGYEIRDFQSAEPDSRHLILRHDVDQSVEAAVEIGEIEARNKWRATYFVLLRSEMYNLYSRAAHDGIMRLLALGHQVGLHLDASLYVDQSAALDAAAAVECAVLERLLCAEVTDISFHRPAPALLGSPAPIAGRRHAYQPRFFSDMGYCSDSRGAWRHGHPFDHAALAEGRALQLLTHPVWWAVDEVCAPTDKLERVARRRDQVVRLEITENCGVFEATTR